MLKGHCCQYPDALGVHVNLRPLLVVRFGVCHHDFDVFFKVLEGGVLALLHFALQTDQERGEKGEPKPRQIRSTLPGSGPKKWAWRSVGNSQGSLSLKEVP